MSINEIVLILGMAAVTFGVRYPVLSLTSRIRLPGLIQRALRFVPAAVLSAIIFPAALIQENQLDLHFDNARLYASLITAIIAWRTRNLLLTIVSGMAAFFLWGWLIH
ncbi:MAG: AzlD domain-containing protein [Anaerolineae bacterium]|nr:AzlD domain-containing protein [Anaerolineae bacterium]